MLKLKLIESKGQHNGQVSVNLCIAVADISKHTFIRVCDIFRTSKKMFSLTQNHDK